MCPTSQALWVQAIHNCSTCCENVNDFQKKTSLHGRVVIWRPRGGHSMNILPSPDGQLIFVSWLELGRVLVKPTASVKGECLYLCSYLILLCTCIISSLSRLFQGTSCEWVRISEVGMEGQRAKMKEAERVWEQKGQALHGLSPAGLNIRTHTSLWLRENIDGHQSIGFVADTGEPGDCCDGLVGTCSLLPEN